MAKGYAQPVHTPNADRLAAEGTTFTRAFCNFAWCAPSRNSFMSGRRPGECTAAVCRRADLGSRWAAPSHHRPLDAADRTQAWDFQHHFRMTLPNCTALPEHFKRNGFFTTGVGKLFHQNLPPKFDPVSWTDPERWPIVYGYRNWSHATAGGPQPGGEFDDCDRKLVDLALERLAIAADLYHNSSQPLCATTQLSLS